MFEEGSGLKGQEDSGIYRGKNMTHQQAKEYFFNRIRIQILKAQAGRGRCQDMRFVERLAKFERDQG